MNRGSAVKNHRTPKRYRVTEDVAKHRQVPGVRRSFAALDFRQWTNCFDLGFFGIIPSLGEKGIALPDSYWVSILIVRQHMKMISKTAWWVMGSVMWLLVSGELGVAGSRPPNFILIFIDDQGYQDLGCYRHPTIKTPHLNRMVAEGTRFTDFYSLAPVCSALRGTLLTGCYPLRVDITGVLFSQHTVGLNPAEITLAEILKSEDYATPCISKWHLGPPFLPMNHGFDSFYGLPYFNDMDGVTGKNRNLDRA
ncbi:MAG: Arylsulfatase [Verrucomicrobia subdivision 3 bacterium]|nr:Arylsulfatase [Limisphaerales bacterium]MCS1414526.1 Arylsulfatase [Limisphaerales bacterium]